MGRALDTAVRVVAQESFNDLQQNVSMIEDYQKKVVHIFEHVSIYFAYSSLCLDKDVDMFDSHDWVHEMLHGICFDVPSADIPELVETYNEVSLAFMEAWKIQQGVRNE